MVELQTHKLKVMSLNLSSSRTVYMRQGPLISKGRDPREPQHERTLFNVCTLQYLPRVLLHPLADVERLDAGEDARDRSALLVVT